MLLENNIVIKKQFENKFISDCKSVINSKFTLPKIKKIIKKIVLVNISYDIICNEALTVPNNAYFDVEDQPATNQAQLKPKEQTIEKKILYSISPTSSP